MSNYAWIIDHVNVRELGDEMAEERDTCGPRDAPRELLAQLVEDGAGHTFRMLDDDGIWYYRGRIVFVDDAGPAQCRDLGFGRYCVNGGLSADHEFGPLDDFGTPNAGCTEIQYRCVTVDENGDQAKVWATL